MGNLMYNIVYRFAKETDRDLLYDFALHAIASADIPEFAVAAGSPAQIVK